MIRLNPYAAVQKRNAILTEEKRKRVKQAILDEKRGVSKIRIIFLKTGLILHSWDEFYIDLTG